jgi:hypothetical protein
MVDKTKASATGVVTLRTGILDCLKQLRISSMSVDTLMDRIYHAPENCRVITIAISEIRKAIRVQWDHSSTGWAINMMATELTSTGLIPKTFLKIARKKA